MCQYEIEFLDGDSEILKANIIAENIIARIDDEGYEHMMLGEVEDHCILKDAIPKSKGIFITKQGKKRKKHTTCGWELLVRWKYGSSNWVSQNQIHEEIASA